MTVRESPVSYVAAQTVTVSEGLDSYVVEDSEGREYTRYTYYAPIYVFSEDGTSREMSTYSGGLWYDEDTAAPLFLDDGQSPDNEWGIGEHTVTVRFMGRTATLKVVVKENPVERVEFHDITLREGFDTIWIEYDYWVYDYLPSFTVYFKDGTSVDSTNGYVDIGDLTYYAETTDYQQYACWEAGDHEATGSFCGFECPFTVTVAPNPYTKLEIEETVVDETLCLLFRFSGDGVYEEHTCFTFFPMMYYDGDRLLTTLYPTDGESFYCTFSFKYGSIGMPLFDQNVSAHVGNLRSNTLSTAFLKSGLFRDDLTFSTLMFNVYEPTVPQVTRAPEDADHAVAIALNTMLRYLENADVEEIDGEYYIVAGRQLAEVCTLQIFGYTPDLKQSSYYDPYLDRVEVPFYDWADLPYAGMTNELRKTENGYVLTPLGINDNGTFFGEDVDPGHTVYLDEDFCVVRIDYNVIPEEPDVPLQGDIDGDGDVTMKDLLALRQMIVGAAPGDEQTAARADVNGDGTVNMKDILLLRKILAGAE